MITIIIITILKFCYADGLIHLNGKKGSGIRLKVFSMSVQLVTLLNSLRNTVKFNSKNTVKFNSIKTNNLETENKKRNFKKLINKHHFNVPFFLMKHDTGDAEENRTSRILLIVISTSCIMCLDEGIAFSLPVLVNCVVCRSSVRRRSGTFNNTDFSVCFCLL